MKGVCITFKAKENKIAQQGLQVMHRRQFPGESMKRNCGMNNQLMK